MMDIMQFAGECRVADPERFVELMERLFVLLETANREVNLTRITGREDFLIKHVADSLALGRAFPEITDRVLELADVGCGAGFPSLVLAAAYPGLRVTAIDSTAKKLAFVGRAAAGLGLNNLLTVHGRANELNRQPEFREKFEVVTARAVAPAERIAGECRNFLKRPGGRFLLYQTPPRAREELAELPRLRPGFRWEISEPFSLPEGAGERIFLIGTATGQLYRSGRDR